MYANQTMTIKFNLNCATEHGEEMLLNIIVGRTSPTNTAVYPMTTGDRRHWQCLLDNMDTSGVQHVDYYYSLAADGSVTRREWAAVAHRIDIGRAAGGNITVYNRWNGTPEEIWLQHTLAPRPGTDGSGSIGIADFGELKAIVDNALQAGLTELCLAPVYDTTTPHTHDGTCRMASIFALNPTYADTAQMPPMERTMHSAAFRRFFKDNERWLVPYAQYSYLRDAYGTHDFSQWPRHREWTEAERGQLANPRTKAYKKLAPIYYMQFVLDRQLTEAHLYAKAHGIALTTCLPCDAGHTGCDAWFDPEPTHTDGRLWWARCMDNMARHFDAVRIEGRTTKRTATNIISET